MEKISGRSHYGKRFTLIELLIVMAILMILMGILIPAVSYVRNRASMMDCQSRIAALRNAISQYEMEYGQLPLAFYTSTDLTDNDDEDFIGGQDITTTDETATNKYDQLIEMLCLQDAGCSTKDGADQNPRKKLFLQHYGKPGTPYADPWDKRFLIKFDDNSDGGIATGSGVTEAAKVLIYSYGPDGDDNNGKTKADGKDYDDIRSW